MCASIPGSIETEHDLDELLSRPSESLVEAIKEYASPIVVLGAGGKMGPTLAVMARRAADAARRDIEVIAVSRFGGTQGGRAWLESQGVATIAADLLSRSDVESLPDAGAVIYMAGRKFGTTDRPDLTWAMNTIAPAYAMERYCGVRFVALSTGCVYPQVDADGKGSCEQDELTPFGEYSNSCVARERIFEYYSQRDNTPVCLVRLNYAVEMRYGVLVDIGTRVLKSEPVSLASPRVNVIWQGDASNMILGMLRYAEVPPRALNLTEQTIRNVRDIAEQFGRLLGRDVVFSSGEGERALLSDSSRAISLLGQPSTPIDRVIEWTAKWLLSKGRQLGRPTHFEATDGKY